MMSLAEINAMAVERFVHSFGDIAEHSPWVALQACASRPYGSVAAMITAFQTAVMAAAVEEKLKLLQSHPDLANRASLTKDSTAEQKGAGLDTLSAEEFAYFTTLNSAYKLKNGFPFIFAVKGADKHQIISAFETRLNNDKAFEFETAVKQVCRIMAFRLEAKVKP